MSWPRVIVFAVIVGVVTALLNLIPALKDTSATDIAVSYEWWLLFGVIVATNCERPLEAALKVFVFFLVSQPLVYLVEMPFLGSGVWSYYPYWFRATLLCLPAGALANKMRDRGALGMVALVLALAMLFFSAVDYGLKAWLAFPRHLVSALLSAAVMVVLVAEFARPGKARAAMAVAALALVVASFLYQTSLSAESSCSAVLPDGQWSASLDGPGRVDVSGDELVYYYRTGSAGGTITCTDESGQTVTFDVALNGDQGVDLKQR